MSSKVRLTQVLSQLVDLISENEQIQIDPNVTRPLFGKNHRPPPTAEPTVEQLSGLKSLLASGQAPFADFALF